MQNSGKLVQVSTLVYPFQCTNFKQYKGPYLNEVYTGKGEGGYPDADIVREVAWI